ncbi:MAG: hypothetical protein IJT84_07560 [Clostridia bacterium]|nr:hypothetical protein [Clostridia bacterium]
MRKVLKLLSVFLVVILFCGIFVFSSFAKELEPCRLCSGKGGYHCVSCGNTGSVTCRGCGGSGKWTCPGEDGKGKCTNGYYTCQSCNGDGKNRSGDGNIIEGNCGNCKGMGKLECWTCHGNPNRNCDKCSGTGKEECQVETCKVSKAYGWKCPDCKGTGFILVGNPMPPKSKNDGVQNVPSKGDYIVTNDKTWAGYKYGSSSDTNKSNNTSSKGNNTSSKTVVSSNTESTQSVPDFPDADMTLVPENRNSNFDISLPVQNDVTQKSALSVRVETGKMSDKQQKYYADLSDEKLAQILTNVRTIVASAQAGRSDSQTDKILSDIAEKNGFNSLADGKLFPLYFEGHQDVGFPICVTLGIDKGVLAGGSDIFVYHISNDGTIELLGKADYNTYDDGTVESLSFYTSSFSSFFTSSKELDVDIKEDIFTTGIVDKKKNKNLPIIIVSVILIAILVTVVIMFLKKRKREE